MSQAERELFEQINECISITMDANIRLRVVNKFGLDSIKSICAEFENNLNENRRLVRLAHDYMRKVLNLDDSAPRRFDYYAQEIDKRLAEANSTIEDLCLIERQKTDQVIACNFARTELEQQLAEAERRAKEYEQACAVHADKEKWLEAENDRLQKLTAPLPESNQNG